jgi:23S rRNA pseudouridine2605 synthase
MSTRAPPPNAALPLVPRRADKALRDLSQCSVTAARRAFVQGRVRLERDGSSRIATEDELVFEQDVLLVDGAPVESICEQHTAMLNKPLGVTSTARDPRGRADLQPFLAVMPPGIFPIGRLDRQTSGLLLFTTDGDLSHAVLHPDHHTEKVYWLWLDEHVADDDPRLTALTEGIVVQSQRVGGAVSAKRVHVLHRSADFTELHVTLNEGKNRQIRRMCRALDLHLVALHRRAVGPIELGSLAQGEYRLLTASEVEALWDATGGRQRVRARKLEALERAARQARERGAPHRRLEDWLRKHGQQGARHELAL